MELHPITWVIPVAGLAAIAFALYLAWDVLRADTGTEAMQDIAGTDLRGRGRLHSPPVPDHRPARHRRRGGHRPRHHPRRGPGGGGHRASSGSTLGIVTALAFLVGAACSMASGIIGMYISVQANLRTAAAAQHSLVEAVQVAMRGGAVSGFLVVALSSSACTASSPPSAASSNPRARRRS